MYAKENQSAQEISLHRVCTIEENECKNIDVFFKADVNTWRGQVASKSSQLEAFFLIRKRYFLREKIFFFAFAYIDALWRSGRDWSTEASKS